MASRAARFVNWLVGFFARRRTIVFLDENALMIVDAVTQNFLFNPEPTATALTRRNCRRRWLRVKRGIEGRTNYLILLVS